MVIEQTVGSNFDWAYFLLLFVLLCNKRLQWRRHDFEEKVSVPFLLHLFRPVYLLTRSFHRPPTLLLQIWDPFRCPVEKIKKNKKIINITRCLSDPLSFCPVRETFRVGSQKFQCLMVIHVVSSLTDSSCLVLNFYAQMTPISGALHSSL